MTHKANILWLKVAKGFVCNNKDVFVVGAYYSYQISSYTKSNEYHVLDTLCYQLSQFCSSDIIFIGEDFNSRIGNHMGKILML